MRLLFVGDVLPEKTAAQIARRDRGATLPAHEDLLASAQIELRHLHGGAVAGIAVPLEDGRGLRAELRRGKGGDNERDQLRDSDRGV